MATPLVVQTKTTANNAGGASGTAAFTSNNKAGNLIIVITSTNSSDTITTPTDTQSNTYTQIFNQLTSATRVAAFYAINIKSGANTVTTHYGGANNEFTIIAREYSGLAQVAPFDTSTSATGSSTLPSSGNTTATGNPYRLVVGLGGEGFGSTQVWTKGASFGNLTSVSTNSAEGCAIQDMLVGAGGAVSAGFTLGTSTDWVCGVATFMASGGSFRPNTLRPAIFKPGIAR